MAKSETRDRILQAAYRCFYEAGFNGTSVQDVVDAVGAPKGTFYNHFKSKEDLALEVLKHYGRQGDSVYSAPVPSPGLQKTTKRRHHVEFLRSRFTEVLRFLERERLPQTCLMGKLGSESLVTPASFGPLIQESFARWTESISAILDLAKRSGEIDRRVDSKALAQYIFASWQGSVLMARAKDNQQPIEVFLSQTFDVLLKTPPRPTRKKKPSTMANA